VPAANKQYYLIIPLHIRKEFYEIIISNCDSVLHDIFTDDSTLKY